MLSYLFSGVLGEVMAPRRNAQVNCLLSLSRRHSDRPYSLQHSQLYPSQYIRASITLLSFYDARSGRVGDLRENEPVGQSAGSAAGPEGGGADREAHRSRTSHPAHGLRRRCVGDGP